MKRGPKTNGSNSIEGAIGYLHGRIEKELEQFAIATGTPFTFVATRIAELLHPMGQRVAREVPLLRSTATGNGSTLAALEVAQYSHHDETPPAIANENATHRKVGRSPWAGMSPEERSKEMTRRRLVAQGKLKPKSKSRPRPSDDPEIRKFYLARHEAKKKGLPLPPLPDAIVLRKAAQKKAAAGYVKKHKLSPEQRAAKQKIYQARHNAMKAGQPLPPLPGEQLVVTL